MRSLKSIHLCLILGLSAFYLAGPTVAAERLKPGEEASFAIPRMSAPPKIDGVIDPAEWREAVAISGVVDSDNLLIPRPTTFLIAWDAEHFYFACRTYVRAGYKPYIRDGRSEGKAYCYDDGLELIFKPNGQNVQAGNKKMAYRMFLNCLGYTGDLTRLVVGQQIKNWAPDFERAVRITKPGTAPQGGSWWELEVSASLDDFELKGPHRAGDTWNLMFAFNHMPVFNQPRLPAIGSFFTPEGKCVGTLVENTPAVQFTMDSLSNLASDGTAAMTITAHNPADKQESVRIDIDVAGKITRAQTLALPPGGSAKLTLNEKLPKEVKNGVFTVRATQGERTLLSYRAFFEVGKYNNMLAKVTPPEPNKFAFIATYNPVRNKLLVKADAYYLPDPEAAAELRYSVTTADRGEVMLGGTITEVAEWYFQKVLDLPTLDPAKYEVSAELVLKDGTRLGPMTHSFEKKDEAKAFPEWWGTKFGDIERVLPPFTAIKTQKSGVSGSESFSCWGREYTLNALGLPDAVSSQGKDVLTQPARLVVVVDGKEHVIKLGAPRITERQDWRVRFEGQAEGGGLAFAAKGWLEQDGLVYVDLTYAPAGKAPINVDALRIEYPMAESETDCLLCIGSGCNYASKTTMVLPRDRQGRLWSTLDTGLTGARMTVGSFYPTVWIGNEQRGFLWWADNDRGWFPDNDVPAHEVYRSRQSQATGQGTAIVLRNNIIGKPVQLTSPRTIAFSYMASPFKPLPSSWRTTLASSNGTFFEPFHGSDFEDPATGEKISRSTARNWIHPNSRNPKYWEREWSQWKKGADARVADNLPRDPWEARHGVNFTHKSFQLIGYGIETGMKEELDYFGEEWVNVWLETYNPTMRDHWLWLFNEAFSKGGLRSTYWDLTFPILYDSLLSDLAYRLPDGRVQPGYNGWNIRRFFMRLWALQEEYGLNPGAVETHSTNAYVMVSLPWVDTILDGERGWDLDVSDQDWVDYYPPARMRALSVPHNWGVAINWMGVLHSQSVEKIHHAKRAQAEYLWMHDSWMNPTLCHQMGGQVYRTFPQEILRVPVSILEWGMNEQDVVFYPYWNNPFVSGQQEGILVSLWRLPGQGKDATSDRVVIGVFNLDRKEKRDVSLKVDLDALNLVPQRKWQEFVRVRTLYCRPDAPAASLDFPKRVLKLQKLEPHEGRFIGIRRY